MSYTLERHNAMIGHEAGSVGWPNMAYGKPVATAFQGPSSYPSYGAAGWQTKDEYNEAKEGNRQGINSAPTPAGPYAHKYRGAAVKFANTKLGRGGRRHSRSRKQNKSRKQRKSRKGSKGRKTRRSQ